MNFYWIESGDYLQIGAGKTPKEAAINAFKHTLPKKLGLLTEIRDFEKIDDDHIWYIESTTLLEAAGFKSRSDES